MEENGERITYFAETDARGRRTKFGIRAKDRSKHVYVIGKTGMGKSTLLENMAVQDIVNGEGLAFIDPHGASAEKLLDYIPKERIKDVLYFAPFDLDHPISFNILEDIGADKRHLVVNGLMSTFEKIWVDAWSARMAYILQNTLLALLEYPGTTLLGVNRMYTDKAFRNKIVANIKDPSTRSFWVEEYAKYTDRYTQEATPAIQNKVGQFTSNPLIRNIIGQARTAFNIRDIMDNKKILIANLSKGRVGEGNVNILGSMLITRIYLAAMSRADVSGETAKQLPNFYLYVDEFQSFANKSFENILSEARKYNLNLTIAHQYIEQMEEEIRDAVFGNVGTMIMFRVGAYDADVLEKEFAPTFYAQDLVSLGFAQVYLKLMIDGISSPPFSATTLPPIATPDISYAKEVIEWSRSQYGKGRRVVEDEIRRWHEPIPEEPKPDTPRAPRDAMPRKSYGERREYMPRRDEFSKQRDYTPPRQGQVPPRRDEQKRPETFERRREISLEELKNVTRQRVHTEQTQAGARRAPRVARFASPRREPPQDTRAANLSKEPSEKHKEELRSALSGILQNTKTKTESKKEPPKKMSQAGLDSSQQPPEIPEEKLRNMLEVKEK